MNSFRRRLKKSLVLRALRLLPSRDRRYLLVVICLQSLLGILDLIGIAIIGVLGALAITGVSTGKPGDRVNFLLQNLGIANESLQFQAATLGILAAVALISKTLISVFFSRKIIFFLSRRSALLSSNLLSKVLNQDFVDIRQKPMQHTLYSVTAGVDSIMLGVVGTALSLVSDMTLLLILGSGLFFVDSTITFLTFLTFSGVAILMYRLLHLRSQKIGHKEAQLIIEANEKIIEILSSYRELLVRNRRQYYWNRISDLRYQLADTLAEKNFMPNITKYILEVILVVGALALGAFQFASTDAVHAVAVLSIFLAASTRISPAILRMQQAFIIIKGSVGSAGPTLALIEELADIPSLDFESTSRELSRNGFSGAISLKNVSYRYPGAKNDVLTDLQMTVSAGDVVAIVGPSGAGKTTFADVILGLLDPTSGLVRIDGLPPKEVIKKWPGVIGYVPQDVLITNRNIRENVALGFDAEANVDEAIWKVLQIAQLDDYVRSLPDQLETRLGDRGGFLSGGQRQRLGIARALYTNPGLVVLDEATSALDGETEANVSAAISNLKGRVTVVLIAHRLSTIKNVDKIFYLQQGKFVATGNFDELRLLVPDFDKQAKLMGL
jgi:ABC-type multidrug transport system fused ATPase/permease subunit